MAKNVNSPKTPGGSWWQRKGKGPLYRGYYVPNGIGQRTLVLVRVSTTGKVVAESYESHEKAKQAGWAIVTRAIVKKAFAR